MIRSFRHHELAKLWVLGRDLSFQLDIAAQVIALLDLLDAAESPSDVDFVGIRFDSWQDGSETRYGITLTERWLVSFAWHGQDAVDVDFETIN